MDLRKRRSDFVESAKQELLREFRERNAIYLVAEIDSAIAGYVRGSIIESKDSFFRNVKIGYLNALAVLVRYRGRGIASKLNRAVEQWFKDNSCSQCHLEVFENNPAIRIYEKWGYKKFNRKLAKKLSS